MHRDPRVFLLDGGTLVIDESDVHWHRNPGRQVRIPVYSVLVDHPDGLILYDSGFDLEHMLRRNSHQSPLQEAEQTLTAQLGIAGFRPSDVDVLVNSHLHHDHVGGNGIVPQATHLVHEAEWAHALEPLPFEAGGYSDPGALAASDRRRLISGDQEIVDGVQLLETPGHTAGHYSLLVGMRRSRSMLFCGDAAYTFASLHEEWIGGFHWDPTAALASIRRLNSLAQDAGADLYPSHDAFAFRHWRRAPLFYGDATPTELR